MLSLVLLLLHPTQPLLLQSPSLSLPWTWPAGIRETLGNSQQKQLGQPWARRCA